MDQSCFERRRQSCRGSESTGAIVPEIELQLARPPPCRRVRRGREAGPIEAPDGSASPAHARAVLREITSLLRTQSGRLSSALARNAKSSGNPSHVFGSIDVEEFATLAVSPGCELWSYLEEAIKKGVPVEAIFEDLLAPAARRLGEMWDADDCDFLSVTTAAHRLQIAVRRLALARSYGCEGSARGLFLPAPGETHVWDCRSCGPPSNNTGGARKSSTTRACLPSFADTGSISWRSRSVAIT